MAAVLDGIVGFNANDLAGLRINAQWAAVAAVDDAGGPGVVAEVVDRVGHGLRESRRHEAGCGKSGQTVQKTSARNGNLEGVHYGFSCFFRGSYRKKICAAQRPPG